MERILGTKVTCLYCIHYTGHKKIDPVDGLEKFECKVPHLSNSIWFYGYTPCGYYKENIFINLMKKVLLEGNI